MLFFVRFAEKLPELAGLSLSICPSATLVPSRNIQPRQYQPVSTFLINRGRAKGSKNSFEFAATPNEGETRP